MKKDLKSAVTFSVFFVLTFNIFFLGSFTNDKETSNMFVLISIIAAVIIVTMYTLIKRFALRANLFDDILMEGVLLYFISELTISCLIGELCFFGIGYKLNNDLHYLEGDILVFREARDFAFSISFLIAGTGFILFKLIKKKWTSK